MAKGSKNKKKLKKQQNLEFDREIRHLETTLKYTLRSIGAVGSSEDLNNLFENQAERIRLQIKKLKQNQ